MQTRLLPNLRGGISLLDLHLTIHVCPQALVAVRTVTIYGFFFLSHCFYVFNSHFLNDW